MTDEIRAFCSTRLHEAGVATLTNRLLLRHGNDRVALACTATGKESELACDMLILATGRLPDDSLHH